MRKAAKPIVLHVREPFSSYDSSDSDSDSDSGSEFDSPSPPPPLRNTKLKPLLSKPTNQTPKPKDKTTSKRPAKNNQPVNAKIPRLSEPNFTNVAGASSKVPTNAHHVDEKTDTTSSLTELIRCGLDENVVKRGMELLGASKKAEFEGQWKGLRLAELELPVKRAELVANQARLILEAYKSANH